MNENFPNWFSGVSKYFLNLPDSDIGVLQIGVYTGDATDWLLSNKNIKFIDDVDTWSGSEEHDSDKMDINFIKVEEYYDSRFSSNSLVNKHKMTSDSFFNSLNKEKTYDFIYIDGDHTTEQTLIDAIHSFSCLKQGGIIAFDDYQWDYFEDEWKTPKKGIDVFVSMYSDKIEIIESGYQLWIKKIKL